ncbi:MAG: hypothetical protein A2X13_14660 [Bacteroidetes bacterium GWC2_33_15]|nr:MAG: hypothetical protein A2X10_06725 [Bacteroidetes bacterium GWA2_33_15]OFX50114.1 MAG: hypothetical protein A2X13_14660 [Bacteroidetes bacterium GWC2_33_15]OFX65267.1 MAG: hypothetical protein A2X15_04235 [Bacteroidetes bacterium GWB2_32_14]OFX70493.1 MAG: hypothetical protein A2X14_04290 [Bacteroidetes bacterium GWD2_33_33]HAN19634.1 hypothetical protein [Bacteroidales bacterium]HAN20584.1 hypothetical protein [Clostridiales bacterium]
MHNLISEILSGVWLIEPQKASGYLPIVANLLKGESNDLIKNLSEKRLESKALLFDAATGYRISEYGVADSPEKAPENSVVIIPVAGPITKYDQFCGPSGTKTKADILQRADSNPNIVAAILEIDSGGGEGAGTQHFAQVIKNTNMPVIAFVEDMAASAAYWIASQCDIIVMQEKTSQVGSIGAYTTLVDVKRYFKNIGLDILEVYAKQSTEKNKAFREAFNNDDTSLIKDKISEFNQFFINDIKSFRGEKIKSDPFKGQMYFAEQAVEIGLADEIGTLDYAIKIAANLSKNYNQNPDKMKIKESWKALVALFGSDTTELKEEGVEKINNELQSKTDELATKTSENSQLKTDLETEKAARVAAENSLKTEQEKVATLETEKAALETKLAAKPAVSSASPEGTDPNPVLNSIEEPFDEADEVAKSILKHK